MSFIGEVGEGILQTRGEVTYEWEITDFFSLSDNVNDRYNSPAFSCAGSSWYLQLYPNGQTNHSSTGYFGLYLYRKDSGAPKTMCYVFGIKGSDGTVEKKTEIKHKFPSDGYSEWGLPKCWSRKGLKNRSSTLMPNNVLTITCDLKSGDAPSTVEDSYTQTENILEVPAEVKQSSEKLDARTEVVCDLEGEVFTSSEKRGGEKALAEDLAKLLSGGEGSDVTVEAGGVDFPVHSAILYARCPALSASLRHESKEKSSRRIVVEDCEADVFRDFLHHLYSGSPKNLSRAINLYRVADKYLVDDLKQRCLEHIQHTLSIESFCDTMKLALTHRESDLFQQAVDFATQNIESIVCSGDWQTFIREHPTEANEIFIKSIPVLRDNQI